MKKISSTTKLILLVPLLSLAMTAPALPQTPAGAPKPSQPAGSAQKPTPGSPTPAPIAPATTTGVTPPADYVIGPGDILVISFWREKDLSSEAIVRPDGRISLPLINDVVAAGLTPEGLRQSLMKLAEKFVEDTNVTVVVKQINSRWVYITGQVSKPGPFPLVGPTTVLQLIAMSGGLLEYADGKNVVVMRNENGKPSNFRFNYNDVVRQKNLNQNILLKPGDTVVVP